MTHQDRYHGFNFFFHPKWLLCLWPCRNGNDWNIATFSCLSYPIMSSPLPMSHSLIWCILSSYLVSSMPIQFHAIVQFFPNSSFSIIRSINRKNRHILHKDDLLLRLILLCHHLGGQSDQPTRKDCRNHHRRDPGVTLERRIGELLGPNLRRGSINKLKIRRMPK